jgi:hypothetical protein
VARSRPVVVHVISDCGVPDRWGVRVVDNSQGVLVPVLGRLPLESEPAAHKQRKP